MNQLTLRRKSDPALATPDPEQKLIDQLRPGVRESHASVRDRGTFGFPFHDRLEEFLRAAQFPGSAEKLDNFPDRFAGPVAAQVERDMAGIEQRLKQRRDHEIDRLTRAATMSNHSRQVAEEIQQSQKQSTPGTPASLYDQGYVNAMSHFYRGEMGRIMIWRTRLDTTTKWAVTSSTAIITIAFSNIGVPHLIFFFNLAIVWIMLWIEARRYRFYDAFRARVRMLEAHFLVPMVMENRHLLQGEWKKLVCEDLILPSFKISMLEAVGRRLKRNYVFIFLLIMIAWVMKIFLHARQPIDSVASFYHELRVGYIASWFVAFIFVGTLATVIGIAIYVGRKTSGEITEFGSHRTLWRI